METYKRKNETVWLTLEQMSKFFERDKSVISRHIKNIFKDNELDYSVVANFATTAKDGKVYQVEYYNLDMIISVGYRVKSKRGIEFRKWANKILKDYLIKGYSINNKRLEYLEKTIKLIDIASRIDNDLDNNQSQEIIKVFNNYSKSYNLLDEYDLKKLSKPIGNKNDSKITYEECLKIINTMKESNNSKVFALEKDNGLESIINNIYLTYNNKDLYPTIEEKASNFLYLIIKNHIFIDGNKRIGAMLFIYFLNFYNILYKNNQPLIDNNTLVSITLLIAQSNPKEKEILIDLIMNFLISE